MTNLAESVLRPSMTVKAIIGLCLVAALPALAIARDTPLNVVVILADDLGWADLGCYGADLHETPHLDRLAGQGMRFTDAYAAPVCSPTRASLLTGKHWARLGITTWRESSQTPPRDRRLLPPVAVADLPHAEVTLAEVFQSAGYLTALVGKWHLGAATHYPETQGFDVNIGGTLWGAPQTYFFPYRGARRFGGEFRYVPHLEGGTPGEYLTDRLTDEALKIIDRAQDRPFFLYLAHHAPHTPIEAKPEIVQHYERKLIPGLRHQNATYAAMVHSLDESVGRVVDRIEARGLAERTLIVFMSDNGGYIGRFNGLTATNNSPLRSGKGSLYEGGVRVPFIVRGPGIATGVSHEPVYVADLYPTLLELAGLSGDAAHNAQVDGVSFAPILKDPEARLARNALYFHFPHYYPTTTPASALRAGDWKLIEYYEDGRLELFHLKDDLSETNNLAWRQPDRAQALLAQLVDWRKTIGAVPPTVNPVFPANR